MVLPPLLAGAVQFTTIEPTPTTETPKVGALGIVDGVVGVEAVASDVPVTFVAVTLTV
jgi:hypothetical protein